jgi:glycine cleavage system H protein
MTKIVDGLYYTKDDEWLRVEGDEATVGISDYAQNALSDIVYVDLPGVGETLNAGETFGVVESVKAAADLFAPVSGEVTAVNDDLPDTPELVNSDPYGAAWMIRLRLNDNSELDSLMDAAAYRTYCDSRA